MPRILFAAGVLGLLFAAAVAVKNRHEPDPEGERATSLRMVVAFGLSGVALGGLMVVAGRRPVPAPPPEAPPAPPSSPGP